MIGRLIHKRNNPRMDSPVRRLTVLIVMRFLLLVNGIGPVYLLIFRLGTGFQGLLFYEFRLNLLAG